MCLWVGCIQLFLRETSRSTFLEMKVMNKNCFHLRSRLDTLSRILGRGCVENRGHLILKKKVFIIEISLCTSTILYYSHNPLTR